MLDSKYIRASIYVDPLYYSDFIYVFIPYAHSRGNVYRMPVHAGMLYGLYRLVQNIGTCILALVLVFVWEINRCSR